MATILGGLAVIGVGTMWLFSRSPLARAIGSSLDCLAESARGEPGALS